MAADPHAPGQLDHDLAELGLADLERRARRSNGGTLTLRDWVALAEAWRIAQALRDCRGNRSAAARALGIGRRTLYTKMEKLGLVPAWALSRERGVGATLDLEDPGAITDEAVAAHPLSRNR